MLSQRGAWAINMDMRPLFLALSSMALATLFACRHGRPPEGEAGGGAPAYATTAFPHRPCIPENKPGGLCAGGAGLGQLGTPVGTPVDRHLGTPLGPPVGGHTRTRHLTRLQQGALWHALLTKLEKRLDAGRVDAAERQWLMASLAKAWAGQKAALPAGVATRTQALLARLGGAPGEAHLAWPVWPVELSSPFGFRIHPLTGERRFHQGVDLRAMANEEVRSIAEGWVLHAGWAGGYGHMVEVLHPGRHLSRYAHLHQIQVRPGEKVPAGALLGLAGDTGHATGVHLHFELWMEGLPVDPLLYLPLPQPYTPWTQVRSPWTQVHSPWTQVHTP